MKQLVAVLVAAMFAATSFAALAQDKDKGGKMDKKAESSRMDKKSDKKKDGKKKDSKKQSAKSDKMDKTDNMSK